jgi:hypothetical protein
VPWFVVWVDGKPDFRVIGENKIHDALRFKRCWVCGQERGRNISFVIGPMCAITRTTAEPGCHRECAIYSALACPFLTRPKMRRNEKDMLDGVADPAGVGLKRNPGCALVWTTREFKLFNDGRGGTLFKLGDPSETLWFAEGREATRAEVMESIESGKPLLRAEDEGPEAIKELERLTAVAMRYVPAEVSL